MKRLEGAVGVIGGSGLYRMEGLEGAEEVAVDTPFGPPSDSYIVGKIEGRRVAFLARHGRTHRLPPHELNFRANICGFKQLGVDRIVSVSAVGSMKEDIHPLHVVTLDQFIDRTRRRADTFFGDGVVAHVAFGDPVCPQLHEALREAAVGAAPRSGRRARTCASRGRPSRRGRSPSCIGPGASASSAGRTCRKPSLPARPRCVTLRLLS